MGKDFDFDQIGKRMPYRTPEGFLDEMEADIWEKVQGELPQKQKRRTYRLGILAASMAAAASIALVLVFSPAIRKEQDSFSKVERAFAGLSQEDQEYMIEVYRNDIFMNE